MAVGTYLDRMALASIINPFANALSRDIMTEIKILQPEDDTTPEKAEAIFKATEEYAWIKDEHTAKDDWEIQGNMRIEKNSLVKEIYNTSPYVVNLNEGTMNELEELKGKRSVERVKGGRFSEQSPNGGFVEDGLQNSFDRRLK